nr:hypothetical protein [uncultured Methanoregula sp.]
MKCKILPLDEEEINAFLAQPGIKFVTQGVVQQHQSDADVLSGPDAVIYYTTPEDDQASKDRALIIENEALDKSVEIAREVSKDKEYSALKTIAQREIFLLHKYNLIKSDAGTVIELLRPEMASVLGV